MKRWMAGTALSLALVSVAVAEDARELKPDWKVGTRYVFENTGSMRQTMEYLDAAGAPPKMEMTGESAMTIDVSVLSARDGGGWETDLRMPRRAESGKMGQRTMSMSTDDEEAAGEPNPVLAAWKKYARQVFRVTLDASGKVVAAQGMKEFCQAEGLRLGPKGAEFLEMQMGESNARTIFDYILRMGLPSKPVRKGDSWTWEESRPIETVEARDTLSCVLKDWVEKDGASCALIEFSGTTAVGAVEAEELPGMRTEMKDGKVSGRVWFDPELGVPREVQYRMTITVNRQMPSREGVQRSTQDVLIDTTMRLAKTQGM